MHDIFLRIFLVRKFFFWYLPNPPLKNLMVRPLGKLAIRDLNNGAIQELLLVDLVKTQYTRDDDEEPYF